MTPGRNYYYEVGRGTFTWLAGDDDLQVPTDLELLRAAAGGDDTAFHALIDRHADALFQVAFSLSRNRADAEDLMQETMIGAHRGIKKFAGTASVKTWLLQILMRQAAKAWHRSKNVRATISLQSPPRELDRDKAPLASYGTVGSIENRLDVMHVLEDLSAPHREVLVLRELQGLTYEEIAQVLGVPRGTVESRLSRARAEFRRRFDGPDQV